MGAFSNVDYELQNNEAAVSNAFMEDDDMRMTATGISVLFRISRVRSM